MTTRLRHPVRYRVEAILFKAILWILRHMTLSAASDTVGALFRVIGPRLRVNARAECNLRRAFPEMPAPDVRRVLQAMWEHLGRVVAEYAHLEEFHCFRDDSRVDVVNGEIFTHVLRSGGGAIAVTGHFGNWEALGFGTTDQGIRTGVVYRAANNPLVDKELRRLRECLVEAQFPKGPGGARRILSFLKSGGLVAMLVDQKMNDGVPVPFFGHDAMTAPAAAQLALKYGYPLIPIRSERVDRSRFKITAYPPIEIPRTGDREADVRAILVEINTLLESWIRERPEQWLWLHNRWPD